MSCFADPVRAHGHARTSNALQSASFVNRRIYTAHYWSPLSTQ